MSPMLRTGHLHQRLSAFALTLGLLILSGCVDRTISITSTPSGALVYLNDEEVGRTPLVTPFTFYGPAVTARMSAYSVKPVLFDVYLRCVGAPCPSCVCLCGMGCGGRCCIAGAASSPNTGCGTASSWS